jgi:hypothetical protein
VRTFPRVKTSPGIGYIAGGTANLACGSASWGYRHILQRHLAEWQSNAAIAGNNWRDLADLAISAALIDPDVTAYSQRNDTFCYSRLIYLADNRTGKVVGEKTPNVIVASRTKNIITAYPSNTQCDGT